MSRMNNTDLYAAVDSYLAQLFAPEDAILQAVGQSVVDAGLPQISVSATEGKLLHLLARLVGARSILEVGTLAAYSTIWMARALPPDGHVVTLEADPLHAEVARRNLELAGLADRVEVRVGLGLELLPALVEDGAGPFDMVFIDADKPPYADYLEWAVRLCRPGALIVADNVIRDGEVLDADATDEATLGIRRFNDALAAHEQLAAIALQTVGRRGHDGMALAVVQEAAR